MSNTAVGEQKKISDILSSNTILDTDIIPFVNINSPASNNITFTITKSKLFSNVNNLSVANLVITNNATPANSTVAVNAGTIWYDANYIYVSIASGTIKRAALTSF